MAMERVAAAVEAAEARAQAAEVRAEAAEAREVIAGEQPSQAKACPGFLSFGSRAGSTSDSYGT